MITLSEYWMGRDKTHTADLTPDIRVNAAETVARVNELLRVFGSHRKVSSGWRPPSVNAGVKGAAPRSNHMTGKACDLEDRDGKLDAFCISELGQKVLEDIGLWLEHPSATEGWCHVQIVAPKSGRRTFKP